MFGVKVLVTGVNGFVGHHVAHALKDRDIRVIGVGNQSELAEDLKNIVEQYISCDLVDPDKVSQLDLRDIDAIINLAGFANVGESIGQGELYNTVNIGVHTVLYQECINQNVSPRIIAVSSGSVYDTSQPLPITEESKLIERNKANEYAVSKKLMEEAVLEFNDKGMDCIIVRPFNHSGPGQLPGFLLPDLGEQIKQAAKKNEPLMVGNLETKRDYTDVRDVARAYAELVACDRSKLHHTIYNVCSGESRKGSDILRLLAEAFDAPDLKTQVDPKRIRPNDCMDIYGSNRRLADDIGWKPEISVEQMVKDYAAWKKQAWKA